MTSKTPNSYSWSSKTVSLSLPDTWSKTDPIDDMYTVHSHSARMDQDSKFHRVYFGIKVCLGANANVPVV